MKKLLVLLLSAVMVLTLAACNQSPTPTESDTASVTETTTEEPTTAPQPAALSYEQFMAAEKDTEVVIEAWVQLAAYNAEYGNASLYLADADGAYFVYRMNVTPEESKLLEVGKKLRITGFKTAFEGLVEIENATFEAVDGDTYISENTDVTAALALGEDLSSLMSRRISISNVTVVPTLNKEKEECPFLYGHDGSGNEGDDLYFTVQVGGSACKLVVESSEFGPETEVYQAVKKLQIGDMISLEGFLYWYMGPQPHISRVLPTDAREKSEGVMDYEAYLAAAQDTPVVIEGYIQQLSYNADSGIANLFLADPDGAYHVFRMNVTAEEAAALLPGAKIRVEGIKANFYGETEITDGKMTALEGFYMAIPQNITDFLGMEEPMMAAMNRKVLLNGVTVLASLNETSGKKEAFLYKSKGTGKVGDDLFFTISCGGVSMLMMVESEYFAPGSPVYEAVRNLSIGDVLDVEAFLSWNNHEYNKGPLPLVTGLVISEQPSDAAMSYEEFLAAELDTQVTVDGIVELAAYNAEYGNISLFLSGKTSGAYYVYRMNVTEEEAKTLVPGQLIRVKGYKAAFEGELEIDGKEASFELLPGKSSGARPLTNISWIMNHEESLRQLMNHRVLLEKAVVMPSHKEGEEEALPFLYRHNGSGVEGDDIYFVVNVSGNSCVLVVESDEFGPDTEVYQAVQSLKVGDVIDIEAFLYWYQGPQPHVVAVSSDAYVKTSEGAMSYGRYLLAEDDEEVVVEAWIQLAAYNAEYGNVNLFLADEAGAYFVYHLPVTAEEAERLVPGQKIQVKGYKANFNGEVEINAENDASFELLEGDAFFADAIAWRNLAGSESAQLFHQNSQIEMRGAVVLASYKEGESEALPFLYKWNGSGSEGDDIYFRVLVNGQEMTLVLESDEFSADTELYKTIQNLKIGDVLDINAFLYWYEGPQPHVIFAEDELYAKSEGVMSHQEYLAAEAQSKVVIEGAIQVLTAYNEEYGNCSFLLDDYAGAYYVYRMAMSREEYDKLSLGSWVRVTGHTANYNGEIEINAENDEEAGFELLPAQGRRYEPFRADAIDITNKLGDEKLSSLMNRLVSLKGATVVASQYGEEGQEAEAPFLYKWNGSGSEGDDIYFNVQVGEETLNLVVETDEWDADSELYALVQSLEIGDMVDLEAFLYWYEGPQPHVQALKLLETE